MWASSSWSWAWSDSSFRLELRSCESTCWAFLLSVVALRRFSAPSLIFSSLRISLRIFSRCSSSRCCTLESEKSEFWSRPSCWSTDSLSVSLWKRGKKRRWLLLLKSLKRRERWFPTRTWKKGSIFRLLFMRRIIQFDLRNWFAGWRSKAEVMTVKAGNSHPAHIWQNEALQDKRREKLYVCERIVNIWHLPSWRGEAASKQRQHLSV